MVRIPLRPHRRNPIAMARAEDRRKRRDLLHQSPMDHTSITRTLADGTEIDSMATTPEGVSYWSIPNVAGTGADVQADSSGYFGAEHGSFGTLALAGQDLGEALAAAQSGIVARCTPRTNNTSVRPSTSSVHNQGVMRFEFIAEPGFVYEVRATGLKAQSTGVGTRARFRLTATTDGSLATENSQVVAEEITAAPDPDDPLLQLPGLTLRWVFPNTVRRQVSVMVTYAAYGGSDSVVISPTNASPFLMDATKHPLTGVSGKANYLGTVAPGDPIPPQTSAPVEKYQTWTATGYQTWNSDGAVNAIDKMVQGQNPANIAGGPKSAAAVFDLGSELQTIDVAMTNAIEILELNFYIFVEHTDGEEAILRMAHHNATSLSPRPAMTLVGEFVTPRGSWLKVELAGTSFADLFLARGIKGFGISPNGMTDANLFLWAPGSGPNAPWIEARYITN